ncbi:formin-like protein 5 [Dipodomys spectabilis]|uniref:formin-like protein 5 n=1 Tax=Dipodomys spectabilis TaxID=105255 RepID=UPI001C5465F7|nr:formin-like protein 5 [Dipodomys spectabilis]
MTSGVCQPPPPPPPAGLRGTRVQGKATAFCTERTVLRHARVSGLLGLQVSVLFRSPAPPASRPGLDARLGDPAPVAQPSPACGRRERRRPERVRPGAQAARAAPGESDAPGRPASGRVRPGSPRPRHGRRRRPRGRMPGRRGRAPGLARGRAAGAGLGLGAAGPKGVAGAGPGADAGRVWRPVFRQAAAPAPPRPARPAPAPLPPAPPDPVPKGGSLPPPGVPSPVRPPPATLRLPGSGARVRALARRSPRGQGRGLPPARPRPLPPPPALRPLPVPASRSGARPGGAPSRAVLVSFLRLSSAARASAPRPRARTGPAEHPAQVRQLPPRPAPCASDSGRPGPGPLRPHLSPGLGPGPPPLQPPLHPPPPVAAPRTEPAVFTRGGGEGGERGGPGPQPIRGGGERM